MPAILKDTEHHSWQEAVDSNDTRLIEKEAEYLFCVLVNAINLFGFDNVIMEGEINYMSQIIMEVIEKRLRNNTIAKNSTKLFSRSSFIEATYATVTVVDNYFHHG